MIIEKKLWTEYFKLMEQGKLCSEFRLADFDIKEGDTLVLKEWDPKKEGYTGREIRKVVKNLIKFDPLESYSLEDIKKYGVYQIDLE